MSRSVGIVQRAIRQVGGPVAEIPAFLCPGIFRITTRQAGQYEHKPRTVFRAEQQRFTTSAASESPVASLKSISTAALDKLPQQCAGCGAFSQLVDAEGPGFYTLTRGSMRNFLKSSGIRQLSVEDEIIKKALQKAGAAAQGLGLGDFSNPGMSTMMMSTVSLLTKVQPET
jgi:hypothetical protein